ncbi:MAG: ABC transporter permease [Alicyclobacillus sp.]|nr:ABC transporter permease [Alicyclobacillus sp.]
MKGRRPMGSTQVGQLLSKLGNHRELSLSGFILLFLLVMLVTTPTFLQISNLIEVVQNSVTITILALGEIVVILARGIDLSIGASMGFITLLVGKLALAGWPVWLLVLLALGVGLVAGGINGFLVSVLGLPPIIVTLGTLSIYSGAMFVVTNGNWVTNLPDQLLAIGNYKLFGLIPSPVIAALVLLGVMTVLLQYSLVGRHIYAVGNNPDAARLAGIGERRVTFFTYVVAGVLSAIAGIFYLSYNGFSTPSTGGDLELEAIAAAVIGGTNVFGGRGTPVGGVLGAILLGLIGEALVFFHIPAIWNQAVEGIIILVAVVSDAALTKTVVMGRG